MPEVVEEGWIKVVVVATPPNLLQGIHRLPLNEWAKVNMRLDGKTEEEIALLEDCQPLDPKCRHLHQIVVTSFIPTAGTNAWNDDVAVERARWKEAGVSLADLVDWSFEVYRPYTHEKGRRGGGHAMADPEYARQVQLRLDEN